MHFNHIDLSLAPWKNVHRFLHLPKCLFSLVEKTKYDGPTEFTFFIIVHLQDLIKCTPIDNIFGDGCKVLVMILQVYIVTISAPPSQVVTAAPQERLPSPQHRWLSLSVQFRQSVVASRAYHRINELCSWWCCHVVVVFVVNIREKTDSSGNRLVLKLGDSWHGKMLGCRCHSAGWWSGGRGMETTVE